MLVDYGCHVFRTAVTDFDVVFIEYGVELVVSTTQTIAPKQKIRQQHWTLKTYLETQRQQEKLYNQLVNHHLSKPIQQQIQKMQPLFR